MFERLTHRDSKGDVWIKDAAHVDEQGQICMLSERLAAYEDSGLSPEEVQKLKKSDASKEQCTIDQHGEIHRLRDELKRYKQAEQEGRLVVLPCKPGDVVYAVSGCLFYRDDSAPYTPCEVVVIKKTKRGVIMHLRPLCEDSAGTRYHRWFGLSSIGKTVFLTKEEAEKALEGSE